MTGRRIFDVRMHDFEIGTNFEIRCVMDSIFVDRSTPYSSCEDEDGGAIPLVAHQHYLDGFTLGVVTLAAGWDVGAPRRRPLRSATPCT